MLQVANTYTLTNPLPGRPLLVFGPDNTLPGWTGYVEDITTDVNLNATDTDWPGVDGSDLGPGNLGKRTVVLKVRVVNDDPALRAQQMERIGSVNSLRRATGTLSWTEATGVQKQVQVQLAAYTGPQTQSDPSKIYSLSFKCGDPLIYSVADPYVSPVTSGTYFNALNAGQEDTWPTFRVWGGCAGFVITNMMTGQQIQVSAAVADGHFVLIETNPLYASVSMDGNGTLMGAGYQWQTSTLFSVGPGVTQLLFVATDPDGDCYLRMDASSAWM